MNAKHTKSRKKLEKEILESLKKYFPRIGFDGGLYFEICCEACNRAKQAHTDFNKLSESRSKNGKVKLKRWTSKERRLRDTIRKQESISIVFAAMCLEACIWDYAACGTSQNKTEENFGSLNLVGKWTVIPQFLCGSDITKVRIGSTCLLDRLRKLKDARNSFAHPKSKPLPNTVKKAFKAIPKRRKEISAEDAFSLIGFLLGELEKVDETNWWFFQTDAYINSIKKTQESTAS